MLGEHALSYVQRRSLSILNPMPWQRMPRKIRLNAAGQNHFRLPAAVRVSESDQLVLPSLIDVALCNGHFAADAEGAAGDF